MKKNERLQALTILTKVLVEKSPLSHALKGNDQLTPLTKELCFGVCRHYFRLQALAESLVAKRPKSVEVWLILLLGLYQLQFMQKPAYAVVKETVALLEGLKKSWAKGLVNAVLRNFCREKESLLARVQEKDNFLYGHPSWFIQRLKSDWPEDWQAILAANDCHPPMSLRVNQQKLSRADYLTRLADLAINASPHEDAPQGFTLERPCDVGELPGFAAGEVSVQDESAQYAPSLLALAPGLSVLDACCAPGGKLCHILESQPDLALCVGLELDAKRLTRVKENLTRLDLTATLIRGDALTPENWWDGQLFDRILLDAPCSATGVIRRHPDIKLIRSEEDISQVVDLQKALLQRLWPLLAPQGLLVYATCSIFKHENEQQIANFLKTEKDSRCITVPHPGWGRATGYGWQIFPAAAKGDGFFYSVLQKV